MSWSPDGRRILTAAEDRTARICDTDTGRELFILPGISNAGRLVAWSPNGRMLAAMGDQFMIYDAGPDYPLPAIRPNVVSGNRSKSVGISNGPHPAPASPDKEGTFLVTSLGLLGCIPMRMELYRDIPILCDGEGCDSEK